MKITPDAKSNNYNMHILSKYKTCTILQIHIVN
jgi:hypothetical protein